MPKSLEEEETREEYILELLCSEENPKKVHFIGNACTIGTGSNVDVLLKHPDSIKCVVDYTKDKIEVVEGRVKINGETITDELKIHYPCIIEIADQLFRITKTQKEQKLKTAETTETKRIVEYTKPLYDEFDEDAFRSDHTSQESSDIFSDEIKNQIIEIEETDKRESNQWEYIEQSDIIIKGLPDKALQMISDMCELNGESNETEKELEPEMHSDDIEREREERKNKEKTIITEDEDTANLHSTPYIIPGTAQDTEGSFNISRISIFEGIPYCEQTEEIHANETCTGQEHSEETRTGQAYTEEIQELIEETHTGQTVTEEQHKETCPEIKEIHNETKETYTEIDEKIKETEKTHTANEQSPNELHTEIVTVVEDYFEQPHNNTKVCTGIKETPTKTRNKVYMDHLCTEQEVPVQEINPSTTGCIDEESKHNPSTPVKNPSTHTDTIEHAAPTPTRAIRRASISHQIINKQKTEPAKKKSPADKKRKKQKTKK